MKEIEKKGITVGIPRAMLYYRYKALWKTFFDELGIEVKVSGPTDRQIMERGSALTIDEACLSAKIFMGHVSALVGQCDYILVPRISNFGKRRNMCTRFEALYDMTCNIFHSSGQKFIAYNVDVLKKKDEENAFVELGASLGCASKAAKKAYKRAKKAESDYLKMMQKKQELLLKTKETKILLAGHSYVLEDAYIGRTVTDFLEKLGVTVIRADLMDRGEALKQSDRLSPTLKWEMNRELVGSIAAAREKVDGIILVSAFPCGPDSMANDMIMRKVKGIPVLNLVLDGQNGTAGVETRLESFVDIIHFKGGKL